MISNKTQTHTKNKKNNGAKHNFKKGCELQAKKNKTTLIQSQFKWISLELVIKCTNTQPQTKRSSLSLHLEPFYEKVSTDKQTAGFFPLVENKELMFSGCLVSHWTGRRCVCPLWALPPRQVTREQTASSRTRANERRSSPVGTDLGRENICEGRRWASASDKHTHTHAPPETLVSNLD